MKQGRLKYTVAVLGALACAGVLVCLRTETQAAVPRSSARDPMSGAGLVPAIDPGSLPQRALPVHAVLSLLDEPRRGAPAGEPLWQVVPRAHRTFAFPRAKHIAHATPVHYDRSRVRALEIDDALAVEIPGRGRFEYVVDRVSGHANGDQAVHGHLAGYDGDDYRVVLTQGATRTFANVQTPEGVFLLEADGEQGWVFADTLDDLIDHSKTDALFPKRRP